MFKNKISKLFLMLIVVLCSLGMAGCVSDDDSDAVIEQDNDTIVSFSSDIYENPESLNDATGVEIVLTLEGAKFVCEISSDSGSLDKNSLVSTKTINSGESIYYHPSYSDGVGENGPISYNTRGSLIDILIYVDEEIIGYAIVNIYSNDFTLFTVETKVSRVFVDKKGAYVSVDATYAKERLSIARQ